MTRNHEEALKLCDSYTSKFNITSISLSLLRSLQTCKTNHVLLVDVRTEEERNVSMIKGAINETQFEAMQLKKNVHSDDEIKYIVVPYCTIGHRSGIFATQLIESKGWDKDLVFNGQGVVPWSYESLDLEVPLEHHTMVKDNDNDLNAPIIKTTSTFNLHVFGSRWDIADPKYVTTTFSVWNGRVWGCMIFQIVYKWMVNIFARFCCSNNNNSNINSGSD